MEGDREWARTHNEHLSSPVKAIGNHKWLDRYFNNLIVAFLACSQMVKGDVTNEQQYEKKM